MALPSSGATISIGDIRTELLNTGTNNFRLSYAGQLSIDSKYNSGYVPVNRASVSEPNRTSPFSVSEWYSYNHSTSQSCGSSTFTLPGYDQQYSLIKINITKSCNVPVFSSGVTVTLGSAGWIRYEQYSGGTIVTTDEYISSSGNYGWANTCIQASSIRVATPLTPVPSSISIYNLGTACYGTGTTLSFSWTAPGGGQEYSNQRIAVYKDYPFDSTGSITGITQYFYSGSTDGTQTKSYPNQTTSDTLYFVGYYDNPQNGYPPTGYYTITANCGSSYPSSTYYCLGYDASSCTTACTDSANCGNN